MTVLLRGGVYPQTEPIVFTAADSGTKECPITYQAYPASGLIISGGRVDPRAGKPMTVEQSRTRVRRETVASGRCRQQLRRAVAVSTSYLSTARRRTRARVPNKGSFLRTDGPASKGNARGFYFHEGDVKAMERFARSRSSLFIIPGRPPSIMSELWTPRPAWSSCMNRRPGPWANWERQQRYYVENVFEELDEPGEWYLNRTTGTLYYYPLPGETMADVEVVAPCVTSTLVSFNGDARKNELSSTCIFAAFRSCTPTRI